MEVEKIVDITTFIFFAALILSFAGFVISDVFEWEVFSLFCFRTFIVVGVISICVIFLGAAYVAMFK